MGTGIFHKLCLGRCKDMLKIIAMIRNLLILPNLSIERWLGSSLSMNTALDSSWRVVWQLRKGLPHKGQTSVRLWATLQDLLAQMY